MVYQYVVTLKNTGLKYIDYISRGVCIVSIIFFLREYFVGNHERNYVYIAAPTVMLVSVAWNYYQTRGTDKPLYYRFALAVAGVCWFAMPFLPWIGLPLLLLSAIEKHAKFNLEIGFTDDEIVINTLIRRKYAWKDFNNIVLRDDMLTLDFKNNRLLQRETLDEEGDADEDEFNNYCLRQLQKANMVA